MRDRIKEIVLGCVADLNFINGSNIPLEESATIIGVVDSLDFVSLLVEIEGCILDKTGDSIDITAEKAMSRKTSPFKTIGSLIDYIYEDINNRNEQGDR